MGDFKISGAGSFEDQQLGRVSIKGSGDGNADNVRISGKGSFEGGEFGGVSINGSGRCDKAQRDIRINGTGRFEGGRFGKISVNGTAHCDGDLDAEKLVVSGTFRCGGGICARAARVNGTLHCGADAAVKKLHVNGTFVSKGGIKLEADEIECSGTIRIDGQISADSLLVKGSVFAQEIVGDRVVIRRRPEIFARLFSWSNSKVGLIEATTVELSAVNAQTVNGQDVAIGPGCHIDALDCSGILSIHPSSTVVHLTGNYTLR